MQIFYKMNKSLHKSEIGNLSEIAFVQMQQRKG